MRKFTILSMFLFFISFAPGLLCAQQKSAPDSLWQRYQTANASRMFEREFSGSNSPVYHGYQYVPFILPAVGNPFYPSGKRYQGAVDFEGKTYHHLSLLYDAQKDQLALLNADKLHLILLARKKVSWFTLDSLLFINIISDDTINNYLPPSGYYEQLVDGNVRLLVKRKKYVTIPSTSGTSRFFRSQNTYYIKKENRYYKVKTRHSVLKVLSDQKRTIRRYLRKNNLYFGDDREKGIKQAVIFYNKIKKNVS